MYNLIVLVLKHKKKGEVEQEEEVVLVGRNNAGGSLPRPPSSDLEEFTWVKKNVKCFYLKNSSKKIVDAKTFCSLIWSGIIKSICGVSFA